MLRQRSAIRGRGGPRSGFVAVIDHTELRPGRLLAEFRNGANAVRVAGDPRVPALWSAVCGDEPAACPTQVEDLARNHHCTGTAVHSMFGDLMFAKPGELNYVARKFAVTEHGGRLASHPAFFRQGPGTWAPSADILNGAWTLVSDLVVAALPPGRTSPRHHVVVQRIRYFDTLRELAMFQQLLDHALLTDSKFARLGRRIDQALCTANAFFGVRGVRDLYALARVLPVVGHVLRVLNDALGSSAHDAPKGTRVIGGAHVDSKFLVGLCSVRDAIRTEYFDGQRWIELPLGTDDLVVMPGRHAARLGVRPTLHRVLHAGNDDVAGPNLTLSLGALFGRAPTAIAPPSKPDRQCVAGIAARRATSPSTAETEELAV